MTRSPRWRVSISSLPSGYQTQAAQRCRAGSETGPSQTDTRQQMCTNRLSLLSVVNWIKQMVPQPVLVPPGAIIIEPAKKTSTRSSLDKSTKAHTNTSLGQLLYLLVKSEHNLYSSLCPVMSPPPESLSGISLDTEGKVSGYVIYCWFVCFYTVKCNKLPKSSLNCKLKFQVKIPFTAYSSCRKQGC